MEPDAKRGWVGFEADAEPHFRAVIGPPELTVDGEIVLHVFAIDENGARRGPGALVTLTEADARVLVALIERRLPPGQREAAVEDPDGDLSYDERLAGLERSRGVPPERTPAYYAQVLKARAEIAQRTLPREEFIDLLRSVTG